VSTQQDQLEIVTIEKEKFLKISNSNTLRPFFMSIVSPYNHWMFLSSNGGVTAGRKNKEFALFPYYTDDKITESADITGSKTIVKLVNKDKTWFWEPFSKRFADQYNIERNLYKNVWGNKVIFEEINHDLNLKFTYRFSSSDAYGFIKDASIQNLGSNEVNIEILDGLQNILPASVNSDLQSGQSNLVDAYKRNELEPESGMGIYALSAVPVDKAEPSEALKANVVWSLNVSNPKYLVSSLQLENFRNNQKITQEEDVKAEKGAYFVHQDLSLETEESKSWKIVADVNFNHAKVFELIHQIKTDSSIESKIEKDIDHGTEKLINLNASADGLQYSSDELRDIRHYSNTLYNIMRGGIFDDNYNIELSDFKPYIKTANVEVYNKFEKDLDKLGDVFSLEELKALVKEESDKDFTRLCLEYLPLKFSRRHGDPSRPWNQFSINTKDENGNKILDYEGNWRDIFQNWEALSFSYPEFLESMIYKFLNASTFDGYNPYRVTKDGFDWEVIEPDDPWSYIGYWGDHQIIYLLKFLEILEDVKPGKLANLFESDVFVYANVPYRIKSYEDTLNDPKDTIVFDHELDKNIREKREKLGGDGALLEDQKGNIIHVNFIEKILATTLAKVSNFIPEGGIWMNTQRPEWNDANNALVGNGVSMVTLYYLRRFLDFFNSVFEGVDDSAEYQLSKEVYDMFMGMHQALDAHKGILSTNNISDKERKAVLDGVAIPASQFRTFVYDKGFTGEKSTVSVSDIKAFTQNTLKFLEQSIDANKRNDDMYHAYNLMTLNEDNSISISYLDEMLEGQVAVLSAKYLKSEDAVKVLDGLKQSALFRNDQYSYILYPNKNLKGYLQRNNVPENLVESSELLKTLIEDGNTKIIEKDVEGNYHFNANFNNDKKLKAELEKLKEGKYAALVEKDSKKVTDIFEDVFNHKAFTGRSGTFYGYEGLGSIYWHMVSKLQLAVFECCDKAINDQASAETLGRLLEHYYEINEGIGVHKSPKLYGAFSTDPYSHTPYGKGAQQPGMTGQVKEDILSRFGELGITMEKGQLAFKPYLLRKNEFFSKAKTVTYVNLHQEPKSVEVPENSMCFTICQVPVIYTVSDKNQIELTLTNHSTQTVNGLEVPLDMSKSVFKRKGEVDHIRVFVDRSILK
jgi:hypothetical protein